MTDRVGVELQRQVTDLERGMAEIQSVHAGITADLEKLKEQIDKVLEAGKQ